MYAIETPYPLYFDETGQPLQGGAVSFGLPGQNPQTAPAAAYWDSAGTQPVQQPVRTINGFLARNGTPANVYIDGDYSTLVQGATGGQLFYARNSGSSLREFPAALAAAAGASLVGFSQGGAGVRDRDVQARLREMPSVVDFVGVVADGATDNTAAILAGLSASGRKFAVIPYGCKFNRRSVLQSLPTGVVLLDLSAINDFSAPGETSKHIGILSGDVAESDTHWSIDNGHHVIATLNNFGTAGTMSGAERKASLLWACGQYALGSADKRGFRGGSILQWTKEAASAKWALNLRLLAPWVSLSGEYEEWAAGQVIGPAGTAYRIQNAQHYVNAGPGTTGATPPSHLSGTVSDGGVSWTWIDSGDRSMFLIREDNRWLLGQGLFTETWRHKVSAVDAIGHYIGQVAATGASKYARWTLTPTNPAGAEAPVPLMQAEHDLGLRVMKSDGSGDVGRFNDNGPVLPLIATPTPAPTIASAGTIAPTAAIAFVSGTTTISTITAPPNVAAAGGRITLIPTAVWATNTAGNIALASTAVVNRALTLTYDNATAKWYPSY